MSLIRRAMERRGADPTLPWGSSYIPSNGQTGLVAAGVPINDDAALSISTVYRCVQILVESVSTLPFGAWRKTSDRTRIPVNVTLVRQPWPEGSVVDFLSQVVFSIVLRGNFFATIADRDAKGYASALVPCHPDEVMARRDPRTGKRVYRVKGQPVDAADVVHIPSAMVPPGSFLGLNPVEYMRQSWGLAAAAEKYGGQFFANSANPSGIITVDSDMSEEETLEMARAWRMGHQGVGMAGMPAVLTGGARWQQLTISPDDAQFLQTRQFQRHEIASWFGIPPTMLGDVDRSTAVAGIEQFEMAFVTNVLRAYLVRIESAFNALLPPSIVTRFDLSDRLRADTLVRFQAYQLARNSGFMSVNEIRESEGMPAVGPAGDTYLQPMNMAPLGSVPVDPTLKPTNDAGVGQGGGDPNNSPAPTLPDKPS